MKQEMYARSMVLKLRIVYFVVRILQVYNDFVLTSITHLALTGEQVFRAKLLGKYVAKQKS